jgi:hypothetical protein
MQTSERISHTIALALLAAALPAAAAAADLPTFDFTRPDATADWLPTHDVSAVEGTAEGLAITLAGDDPFVVGPPRDFSPDLPLRMTVVVKPATDGMMQVFHFRKHASEDKSVGFPVRGGQWNTVRAMLPPLGPGVRLRIDPPGRTGTTVVERIEFAPAASLPAPRWPDHEAFDAGGATRLESGPLAVAVTPAGFALEIDGRRSAASHARPLVGHVVAGTMQWVDAAVPAEVRATGGGGEPVAIETRQAIRDADGGTWSIRRRFTAGGIAGLINLEVTAEVDRDRSVAFLPLVLLVAHEGTPRKSQAVFPGLEYLADEPSSSEADLVGPQSKRQVPAGHKLTFPLMAVAHDERVVGLSWNHEPAFAAVFDSPDRLLASGGHLLGVIAPGSDGFNRHEGDLMPIAPVALKAGRPLVLRTALFGGRGGTVRPALEAFVTSRGLPDVPDAGSLADYRTLATAGWLDSGVRAGGLFRHAIGPNFPPQPAADAAVYTSWLAGRTAEAATRSRLEEAATAASAAVPTGSLDAAVIGHVRMPVQSLVFGRVDEAVAEHAATARRLLASVRPDGTVAYHPGKGGVDYGRTHDADHANGLSARVVAEAIEAARFAGDKQLIDEAVSALRRLGNTYAGSVPRGAQTWEVPLHTPDILASAHLVRAFTIGYELTGDRVLLDQALAWAWTGLPFLYLVDPVGTTDGPYGCVTVFGATAWKWPVWIGRPVQWCGLVYAHALYRLSRHDPAGPWRQLADGITATGIRYSWPVAAATAGPEAVERQGLLPDGWEVLERFPVDPPINPGTLQACAVELFRAGPLYDCRVLPFGGSRVIVHAPGGIEPASESGDGVTGGAAAAGDRLAVRVSGWPKGPHAVLVTGLAAEPEVAMNGQAAELAARRFDAASGRLVLWLDGPGVFELRAKPRADQDLQPGQAR